MTLVATQHTVVLDRRRSIYCLLTVQYHFDCALLCFASLIWLIHSITSLLSPLSQHYLSTVYVHVGIGMLMLLEMKRIIINQSSESFWRADCIALWHGKYVGEFHTIRFFIYCITKFRDFKLSINWMLALPVNIFVKRINKNIYMPFKFEYNRWRSHLVKRYACYIPNSSMAQNQFYCA